MFSSVSSGAILAQDQPVQGGTLVYLEQQAHTNLYPPAGGFYPNSGILNQITDKLAWQNPATLEIEPWLAESWEINADVTEYVFKLRPRRDVLVLDSVTAPAQPLLYWDRGYPVLPEQG